MCGLSPSDPEGIKQSSKVPEPTGADAHGAELCFAPVGSHSLAQVRGGRGGGGRGHCTGTCVQDLKKPLIVTIHPEKPYPWGLH